MIKQARGHWQRRIPPWATTHICDLRRYRGPYIDARNELARKGRAINRLYAAFEQAGRERAGFLIVRFGERSPRRDAIDHLLRDFVCSPEHAAGVNIGESRQYPDRLVVALQNPRPQDAPVCIRLNHEGGQIEFATRPEAAALARFSGAI